MTNDLFDRAERADTETLRLLAEGIVRAEQTLMLLHRCAIRHYNSLELLGRAIERLAKVGQQTSIEQILADANQKTASSSTVETGGNGSSARDSRTTRRSRSAS